MLEGQVESFTPTTATSAKPVDVEVLKTPRKPSSAPLPIDLLEKQAEKFLRMKRDSSGGATEAGVQATEATVLFHNFLKQKIGLKSEQWKKLPEDLQKQLGNFNPQDEKELNEQGMALYERIKEAGVLDDKQVAMLDNLQRAVVVDGVLKQKDIFTELKEQVKDLVPKEEQKQATEELNKLEQELEKPDATPERKAKSFIDRMPKLVKWVGLGGIVALLFSLWRAFKDTMGATQPMAA